MFYDQPSIDYLKERVGFAIGITPVTAGFQYANSTSGKYFKDYNQLVTIENMYSCVPYAGISTDDFNDYISGLKDENVKMVLGDIFDNEERAHYRYCYNGNRIDISHIDYSGKIQSSQGLFDNVIGIGMAIKCLELFLATVRANGDARNAKFSYTQLMEDLHGIKNQDGKTVTIGLYAKYKIAKEKVLNILFPENKTNYVIGRKVW